MCSRGGEKGEVKTFPRNGSPLFVAPFFWGGGVLGSPLFSTNLAKHIVFAGVLIPAKNLMAPGMERCDLADVVLRSLWRVCVCVCGLVLCGLMLRTKRKHMQQVVPKMS